MFFKLIFSPSPPYRKFQTQQFTQVKVEKNQFVQNSQLGVGTFFFPKIPTSQKLPIGSGHIFFPKNPNFPKTPNWEWTHFSKLIFYPSPQCRKISNYVRPYLSLKAICRNLVKFSSRNSLVILKITNFDQKIN